MNDDLAGILGITLCAFLAVVGVGTPLLLAIWWLKTLAGWLGLF